MRHLKTNNQKGLSSTLILSVIAVVALIVAYAWISSRSPSESIQTLEVAPATPSNQRIERPIEITPLPAPREEISQSYQLEGELPLLGESDDPFKAHLRLLAGALPVSWLAGDQLIQKIVLQVDNAANGDVVYQHSPLLAPTGALSVIQTEEEGIYLLDTSSYSRYNLYADFMAELDQELLLAFYRYYEPLLDQAYIKLGNEPDRFRSVLVTALERIANTPRIEGEIRLTRPLLSYEFEDLELENLSMAEKQLIRMGPENTQKIQAGLQPLLNRLNN